MINLVPGICPPRQVISNRFFVLAAIALATVLSTEKLCAQSSIIIMQGKVIDETGGPMPGATVLEKGTDNAVATDTNGEYTIKVSGGEAILIFSSVGYTAKEETVGNREEINVSLIEKLHELDEVVVVGFGEQRKISVVGAQSTISSEDLKMPVSNINTLLAGRISGVIGVQRSGEPGRSSSDIWIRGIATFGGGSASPLILVDGVERPIDNIDPQDIASFTILKDAAGTAVYGVRGANGVILVTTKRGHIGKPQVTLDYSEGITDFVLRPKLADAKTYMEACNESYTTRNMRSRYSDDYIDKTLKGVDPELYPNVDWFKTLMRDFGHVRRANANVSGGSNFLQYYGSLSYYDEDGLLKTDKLENYNIDLRFKRMTVSTNVKMKITKSTELDIGIRGFFSNLNKPNISTEGIFGTALGTPPTMYPLEYTGGFIPGTNPNGGDRSPWEMLTKSGYTTEYNSSLNSNMQLTQHLDFITKGLKISGMFSFDSNNGYGIYRGKRVATYWPNPAKPRNDDGSLNLDRTYSGTGNFLGYAKGNWGNRRFYSQTALNYERQFDKHRVSGLSLFFTDDYQNQFEGSYAAFIPQRYLGLAFRATYSYDDRYFIEGNLGYNGSELFTPKNRYGTFPAAGFGWVASNEKFFAPVKKVVSYLKFRYTDGITGIGRIGKEDEGGRRFAYLTILDDNSDGYRFNKNYDETRGTRIVEYGSDVVWAQSRKQDLGIEIKFHEDHLSLIVDFFKEHRTGIFLQRQSLPSYIGLTSNPWGNLGEVENKGFDGSLVYNNKIGKVDLSLRGNVTSNRNKLLNNDQPAQRYEWSNRVGHTLNARWGLVAEGLFKSQDEINATAVPVDKSLVLPGDIKYKDLNRDGLINSYDEKEIGNGDIPNLVFGFGFNIGYKGFNLGASFTGQRGADVVLSGGGITPFNGGSGNSNVYGNITDRWQEGKDNSNVFYPRLASGEAKNANNYRTSTWWQRDADFIRMKTLELNYRLPASVVKKLAKAVTFYVQAFNALTFTKFNLWDLESTIGTGNGGRYPNIKSYNLGVQINFK